MRAAARAFVRRHRRDAGYLAWVLRAAGASSALAIALLGLGTAPAAAAELAPFVLRPTNLDPLDVGGRSAPGLGDLDGDGDLDVLAGASGTGTALYFENTGGAEAAAFSAGIGLLPGQIVASAALGDLDGDGDLDLVAGQGNGAFAWFENTGSATAPAFAARTGAANPLNGHDIGSASKATLGDLDGDGDLDLLANDELTAGGFDYFENTGGATTPAFALRTGAANPLSGVGALGSPPAFVDLDGDGDLDLVAGSQTGGFFAYENTGGALTPAFVELIGAANPLSAQDAGTFSTPAFGDLDADGDADLVTGNYDGTFQTILNFHDRMIPRGSADFPPFDVSSFATPALGDLDDDGDLDIVAGNNYGAFFYFRNTGSASAHAFVHTPASNPLAGRDVGNDAAPALGDLDGDGDLDVVSGTQIGQLVYLLNTGSAAAPAFTTQSPLALSPGSSFTRPALGDLDDDGDLDLVVGGAIGQFRYFEHTGVSVGTAFAERTGAANPLLGFDLGYDAQPALVDLDGDGDLDLVAGGNGTTFVVYENTGRVTIPAFVERPATDSPLYTLPVPGWPASALADLDGDGDADMVTGNVSGNLSYFESFLVQAPGPVIALTGAANPFGSHDVGALSAPALADLDGDGDLDAVSGEDFGALAFFENTGTLRTPAFAARTGVANPLDGRDVGDQAQPALADLDADGDADALVGRAAGDLAWFANTGDAVLPAFAASVASPFGLAGVGASSAPALGDVDGDGDLDLVVGSYYDDLVYFENTGAATAPAFVERIGVANPFDGLDVTYYARPALADFDRDGDLDLVCGTEGGRYRFFENVGSVTAPSFGRLFNVSNPLDGEDVGDRAAPAAADLNGDGAPDLVTGAVAGTFAVHYFPEPARGWLASAGAALLALLGRARGRARR